MQQSSVNLRNKKQNEILTMRDHKTHQLNFEGKKKLIKNQAQIHLHSNKEVPNTWLE